MPAIARSADRRSDCGIGVASTTNAAPADRAAATEKQAVGGGTADEPTTASAKSPRSRNGNADPTPHATWSAASATRILPVSRVVTSTIPRVAPQIGWVAFSLRGLPAIRFAPGDGPMVPSQYSSTYREHGCTP